MEWMLKVYRARHSLTDNHVSHNKFRNSKMELTCLLIEEKQFSKWMAPLFTPYHLDRFHRFPNGRRRIFHCVLFFSIDFYCYGVRFSCDAICNQVMWMQKVNKKILSLSPFPSPFIGIVFITSEMHSLHWKLEKFTVDRRVEHTFFCRLYYFICSHIRSSSYNTSLYPMHSYTINIRRFNAFIFFLLVLLLFLFR